jgi:uncharacterized protein
VDRVGNSRSPGRAEPMSKVRCPICDAAMPGNWQDYPDYPFCSRRCRMIDLGRWLGEEYRVAGKDAADDRSTPGESGEDQSAR